MGCLRPILRDIYGEITDDLLQENNDELKSTNELIKVIKTSVNRHSPCTICPNSQHQDFPGWIGSIKYESKKITNKDIIIFGLEVSDKKSVRGALNKNYGLNLKANDNLPFIHIGFELGFFKTTEDLLKAHRLWYNLNYIVNLDKIKNKLYFTDIAKCFTGNKKKAYYECTKKFLFKELDCFKDQDLKFILQGRSLQKLLKQYLEFTPQKEFLIFLKNNKSKLKEFGINSDNVNFEIGTFKSKEKDFTKQGKYLYIPHSSRRNNGLWNKFRKFKDLDFKLYSQFRKEIVEFLEFK